MRSRAAILLTSVMIISTCSLLYELLISSMASYFQGSSVLHFSVVIGIFLSSMGVGSYLSRFISGDLLAWFIRFEIVLSLIGGFSAVILYYAFSLTSSFYLFTFGLIGTLGVLIGIEIPLLTRIMHQQEALKDAIAKVLSFDYLGALIGSLLFPLLLLPWLGLMRTAFLIGIINLSVAVVNASAFRHELGNTSKLIVFQAVTGILLLAGFIFSFRINGFFEQLLYRDQILLTKQTAYQEIVVTKWNQDIRLYLDGQLQFSTRDEYRYHEPLVHLPMSWAASRSRVLVLGGGDGLATREILKYPSVQSITVVDLDQAMTDLAKGHPVFRKINKDAFQNSKVSIINQDAFKFIEGDSESYDLIIIDLPDPGSTAIGKLYSVEFYAMVKKRLSAGGVVVTQSSSPYFSPQSFWCIHKTLRQIFPSTIPYTVNVPTFGQWGFNMAANEPHRPFDIAYHGNQIEHAGFPFKYLSRDILPALLVFDGDMKPQEVEVNHLDNQIIVQYYENGWNDNR